MLFPTGMSLSVKVPSAAVVVAMSGEPEAVEHCVQDTPGVKAATAPFGTYTVAPGIGSAPYVLFGPPGPYTVPLTLVSGPPSHVTRCRQSPVQGEASAPASP
jgi:hypothetical protein